jgi:hypothetical protein
LQDLANEFATTTAAAVLHAVPGCCISRSLNQLREACMSVTFVVRAPGIGSLCASTSSTGIAARMGIASLLG